MVLDDFTHAKLPDNITGELCSNSSIKQKFLADGDSPLDFDVMEKRAAIWNPYAKEHGFPTLGSVVTYDLDDPTCMFAVVDVAPRGYIDCIYGVTDPMDPYDMPYPRNVYYAVPLYSLDDFQESGVIESCDIDCLDILDVETVSEDFREYIAGIPARVEAVKELVLGQVVLCCDDSHDWRNYYLMRIDAVEWNPNGMYEVRQSDGYEWLHIGNNSGTYEYYDWKCQKSRGPLYLHFDKNGEAVVRSTPMNLDDYLIDSRTGHFVDTDKTPYSRLLRSIRSCDGVNERYESDPFSEVERHCCKKRLYLR